MSVRTFNEQLLAPLTSSGKSHKLIQLPNGLLVLLISDPSEDLASMALSVSAGAHNDPDDIPGLAHFCEHLLLLGSKNFPNPNEFHDLLTKNGGRRNAFTTGERTCYFFEVPSISTNSNNEPIFNKLVEIFADSFKTPNFNESMFEKEIYAIDNEHNANKNKSGRILYQGLRLISSKNHQFSRFATGNFFTLNDLPKFKKIKVKSKLVEYFDSNYIPENMNLVIKSSQSLNLLTKLIIQNFSDFGSKTSKLKLFNKSNQIIKNDKELIDFDILSNWSYDSKVFTKNELNNCILINHPNNPVLRLFFPYDEFEFENYDLLVNAWSNIVGDESNGSLDEYLKLKDYSIGLNAFNQNLSRNNSVLVIEINLTNTGIKNVILIISIILNYYIQIFNNLSELSRVLFELESIDYLNYLYKNSSSSSMDEVSNYSQNLLLNLSNLKSKNILKGSKNWDNSTNDKAFWLNKSELLLDFINKTFNFKNLRFAILGDLKLISNSLNEFLSSTLELKDQFFQFDYILAKFNSINLRSLSEIPKFNIIPRNLFIPSYALDHSNLQKFLLESSKKSEKASLSFITKNSWSSTTAEIYLKNPNCEIWTKYESSANFKLKTFISFDIILLNTESNPENTMMVEILTELIKLKISKDLYPSELVNYTWEIQASVKGDVRIGFTISGYNDGINIVLNLIIHEFSSILTNNDLISMDEFRKTRIAVRSRYNELNQSNSLSMAISGLLVVLEENIWTLEDRLDSLDDIDFNSFKCFLASFAGNEKFTKILIHGDIKDIDSISNSINKISNHLNSTNKFTFKEPSTYSIKPGKSYKIERAGAKNDPMNSICYFIETGPRNDYYTQKMTKLFSYLMSLTLVPDLRFKKQLGYAVLGGTRILRTTFGVHISVMSATFTPQYLENQIDEYLLNWEKTYINMSESDFKSNVIDQYLKNFKVDLTKSGGPESLTSEMPSSASSSNTDHLGESMKLHRSIRDLISTESYNPTQLNDQEFFSKITKSDFLKFYKSKISNKFRTRSQLSIMIKSQLTPEETQQQLIRLQLDAFLKMNGLRISTEKLKEIVDLTKGNPVYLLKDLFKYFLNQGESFKLCTVVLKMVVKQVSEGIKHYKANHSDSSTENNSNSEKIKLIEDFHKQNKIYYIK